MKKVVLSLAVVAFVVSLASCSKTCTCKTYTAGQEVSSVEGELGDYDNCEAMNIVVSEDPKTGTFCE